MEADDLREILSYEPFRFLRFHLSDGTIILIDHPDMAMLGQSAITLGLPPEEDDEREAVVPLSSIDWVEVVVRNRPKEDKSNGNGA